MKVWAKSNRHRRNYVMPAGPIAREARGGVVSFGPDNPALEADDHRERLQALDQPALEIAELRDLQQVFAMALRHCLELTDSQFGFIGLNAAGGKGMDVVALQGCEVSPRFFERFHFLMPLRPPLLAGAALENQPMRSTDVKHDVRHVGQPRGHPPVRSFLGVPLRLRGTPIGMIGVANRASAYAAEHEHLLTTYASHVAMAIHNAQLYQQAQETAITEERARIAREMHDGVAQVLFYVNAQTEAALTLVRAGQKERAAEQLEQLAQAARSAYADIREDILALRTASTTHSLAASLADYLPRWQEQSGVQAELRIMPADGLPPILSLAVDIQLLRIVQEALANVRRHAQARHVQIRISEAAGQVTVEVEDDGEGFDPTAPEESSFPHFGLATMRERADAVGGRLEIDAAPGRGTRVIVHMPVAPLPREAAGEE
jgi:signal transduction histidine kinase